MNLIPNSGGRADLDRWLQEYNTCHSAADGKFCSKGGGAPDARGFSQGKGAETHRGFAIRKDADGLFHASHPTYRAAHPTGKTLGDIKTQINMFNTGVRNAAARRRTLKATPETSAAVKAQNLPGSATSKTGGRVNLPSDAHGFSAGKPASFKRAIKQQIDAETKKYGPNYVTSHRGVEIHTLPHYTTPYYYGKHPALGSVNHSMSLKRIKNQINDIVDKGMTPRKKASARYQKRKARGY